VDSQSAISPFVGGLNGDTQVKSLSRETIGALERETINQLVEIEKLKFIGISWYKFKLILNSSVSPSTNSNCDFSFAVD